MNDGILNRNIYLLRRQQPVPLSGKQMAMTLKIEFKRYSSIEYHNVEIRPDEFLRICEHYGITTIKQMKKLVNIPL